VKPSNNTRSDAMQTVHVRINDTATGLPTPCRIRFIGPDDGYRAPVGRLPHFSTQPGEDVGGNLLWQGQPYAYVDGSCEVVLPPGEITVEVWKGPEYRPLRQTLVLKPGQIALRLTLERWIDLRQDGWFSGDTQASLPPHAALLEGAAEDLAVVNVLAEVRDRPPSITHVLEFSGQKPALEIPGHLVVVNTLNRGGELGSLGLLNCHRIVYPLRLGGHGGLTGYTLTDWCDQCHRKGGLVTWVSFEAGGTGGEALADVILGKIDAVQVTRQELGGWYDLLSCGVRVPLVGGSGKASNSQLLGEPRTYARLQPGDAFSYKTWIEAVRAGRTFITNGPLLSFTVNGQEAGSVIDVPHTEQIVHVHATGRALDHFTHLEIIWNGRVVGTVPATGTPSVAVFEQAVSVSESGWLAVRCRDLAAHTSPVYLQRTSAPRSIDAAVLQRVLMRLDATLAWVAAKADWESERQRQHLIETVRNAREVLLQRGGT
jgi:hypothetical protein